jgi:hypothetical protein
MQPSTFEHLPEGFYVVRLPDYPKIADPTLRTRGETFSQVRLRPAAFTALDQTPPNPGTGTAGSSEMQWDQA